MDSEAKQRSLTIYLLKDGLRPAEVIAKPAKEYYLAGDTRIGVLYVETRETKPPHWADFFSGYVSAKDLGLVASSSAALLVQSASRLFAITFGQGRYLLDADCIEERFGFKVVLNSIPPERLKSIDKKSFDAIDSNSRVQASREAEAQDFGIDAEQDLLRAVTGIPNDPILGTRLSGRDALNAVARCDLSELCDLLPLYLSKYHEETYKTHFPWVDNIREVTSTEHLDLTLIDILNDIRTSSNTAKCWIAVPEIVDWERVDGFRYSTRTDASIHHDLHLPGFFSSLRNSDLLTVTELKRRHAYAVDGDGLTLNRWPVYKCIHCEIEIDGITYVLSAGKWYAITRDLSDLVNAFFERLPRYEKSLPQYEDARESEYCARVAKDSDGELLLMDQKFVRVAGRTNSIEFCDLYGSDYALIHVKRYGTSNVLNHLFAQGLMSGECLKTLEGFAEELNAMLSEPFKVPEGNIPRDVSRFTVVFAIISESDKPLELPFFARVTLRQVAKRLMSVNYNVRLLQIPVARSLTRLERVPTKPPR